MIEINLRDETLGLEFAISCDPEKGEVYSWVVTCINPLPLQNVINIPYLTRQATTQQTPCQQRQQAMAAAAAQNPTVVKRMRVGGANGAPVVTGRE